ncbi:Protein of unknown function [Cotesia congregata]|uniref:Uncharacterized protein n=1 Tax=Cotesia congregata TaxID=51543 RepID=A0A8J2ECC8_COTCN|nr:Protein of unknown function [Cotesia congregata]
MLLAISSLNGIPVHKRMIHPIPPWELFEPLIDLHVYNNSFGKDLTTKQIDSNLTAEMYDKYNGYCKLYTDGSVKNGKKGCAIIHDDQTFMYRLPDFTNIFSCEVIAIQKSNRSYNQEQHPKSHNFN